MNASICNWLLADKPGWVVSEYRIGSMYSSSVDPTLRGGMSFPPRSVGSTLGQILPPRSVGSTSSGFAIPLVSDGVIYRVLNNLLILQGERISYRTLDVEQIGSVYEAIMGYRLEKSAGRSIALKPKRLYGRR